MKCPRCNQYFKTQKGLERHVSECRRIQGYEVVGRMELDLPSEENGSLLPEMRISYWKSLLDERWARFGKVEVQWDTEEDSHHSTCFIRGDAKDKADLVKTQELMFREMQKIANGWIKEIQEELSALKEKMKILQENMEQEN